MVPETNAYLSSKVTAVEKRFVSGMVAMAALLVPSSELTLNICSVMKSKAMKSTLLERNDTFAGVFMIDPGPVTVIALIVPAGSERSNMTMFGTALLPTITLLSSLESSMADIWLMRPFAPEPVLSRISSIPPVCTLSFRMVSPTKSV